MATIKNNSVFKLINNVNQKIPKFELFSTKNAFLATNLIVTLKMNEKHTNF